ncbi:hypothetical protein NIES4101_36240 [Calothrix sp. NIES-4101]|nr:hypothetical protein NIES4101_36240 [Calothrix sp. NIES-4101]
MALIEYLDRDDWRDVLRRSFNGAIRCDRFTEKGRWKMTSSAIDDMRSWLTGGGINRVQLQIDRQMDSYRLASERQREVRNFLKQLVQENQRSLIQLMADGIIPWNQVDFFMACGISESQFDQMWRHISANGNPFEDWMLANGYSHETIDHTCLIKAELQHPKHPIDHTLN